MPNAPGNPADGPGSCPKCGMALEPLLPASSDDDSESRSLRLRLVVAVALAAPLLLIAMTPHLFHLMFSPTMAWVLRTTELLLSAPVVLWAAADYYRRGWSGVIGRSPNMYTLIGLGVIVAFAFSVVATLSPGSFPREMRDSNGMVGVHFEVAAAIVALVLLGEWGSK